MTMKEIQGRISGDSGWAVPQKGRLRLTSAGAVVEPENGGPVDAPWSALSLRASMMEETDALLEAHTADGHNWAFEAPARTLLAAVRAAGAEGLVSPDRREALDQQAAAIEGQRNVARRGYWRQMRVVLVIFGVILALFVAALQYAPTYVANHFPPAWEDQLGRMTLDQLKSEGTVLTSGPAVDAVNAVWKRLEPGLDPSPYTFRITVVDSPMVNAFAMPGGYVVVYTGLLEEIDGPETLAGILGHETQHVIRKHSLKSLVRSAQWQVGLSLMWALFGNPREAANIEAFQKMATNMDSLAYSRANESESDRGAAHILIRDGIDPIPFTNFFLKLAKKEGHRLEITSTHPPSEGRAATLQEYIKTLGPYKSTPIDVDWPALQKSLRKTASGVGGHGAGE